MIRTTAEDRAMRAWELHDQIVKIIEDVMRCHEIGTGTIATKIAGSIVAFTSTSPLVIIAAKEAAKRKAEADTPTPPIPCAGTGCVLPDLQGLVVRTPPIKSVKCPICGQIVPVDGWGQMVLHPSIQKENEQKTKHAAEDRDLLAKAHLDAQRWAVDNENIIRLMLENHPNCECKGCQAGREEIKRVEGLKIE